MAGISVKALDEKLSYGARVSGVTHESLADEGVRAQLNQLFLDRGVIVFEGVEASPRMQVAISTVFGPLKDHPVASVERADGDNLLGVIEISTGPQFAVVEIDGQLLQTWQPWHFDHAYNDELNRAGVLRAISIAKEGGRTGFADGIQIYRDMDPAIRKKAEGLEVLYNLDLRYSEQRFGLPANFRSIRNHAARIHEIYADAPRSIHPILWTRDSGEPVFHMTPYGARGIAGSDREEDFALLAEIWDEAMRVMQPYHHQWRADDMVLWDNWRMLHEASGCAPEEKRIVHRTTIKGDYGLGRFEEKVGA